MKTTSKLITACAILLVTLAACKKEQPVVTNPANPVEQMSTAGGLKPLPQKMYELSGAQTLDVVKSFKHLKTGGTQSKLVSADSLSADSSIFVLEAALNYDFDADLPDLYEEDFDTSEVSIALGNGQRVSSDDLEESYTFFKDYINSTTSASKPVKVVDIYAFIDATSTNVIYKAQIVTSNTGAKNPCSAISNGASPYKSKFSSFNCGGYPDACQLMNLRLNCMIYYPQSCFNGRYFTNVYSINPGTSITKSSWIGGPALSSSSPSTSFLFNSGFYTASQHCGSAWSVLTPAQLTSYSSAAKTEVNNNVPTSPANMIVVSGWYTPETDLIVGNGSYWGIWWNLHAQYGVLNCRGPLNG